MKPFKRTQRVNKEILRILSDVIQTEIRDPRVRGIVITQVVVSPDFSVASVYVQSVMENTGENALQGLDAAKGFLRTRLSARFRSKKVPKLRFFRDEAVENLEKLEEIFERIAQDD